MPKTKPCIQHPLRAGSYQCRKCNAALCLECRLVTSKGTFCSQQCSDDFAEFQQTIIASGPRKRRVSLRAWIQHLAVAGVLLMLIFGALSVWLGTTRVSEMPDKLVKQIRLMF